jgi:mannitol/fructose-specific phosphotransferase system IIA component (Ntr-type)
MRFWSRTPKDKLPQPPNPPSSDGRLPISSLLSPRNILFFESPTPATAIYRRLIQTWSGVVEESIVNAVMEREKIGATLIDPQIALPHARLPGFGALRAALAFCPHGLDGSNGDSAIRILLLFAGDLDRPRECLAFLSSAAALLGQDEIKEQLLTVKSAQDAFECLRRNEPGGAA